MENVPVAWDPEHGLDLIADLLAAEHAFGHDVITGGGYRIRARTFIPLAAPDCGLSVP